MIIFFQYLKDYFRAIALKKFWITALFTALLIFINYTSGIENPIKNISYWYISLLTFFLFYVFVFGVAYMIQFPGSSNEVIADKNIFIKFFLLAAFLFASKMIHWQFPFLNQYSNWGKYWSIILQLPVKLLFFLIVLFLVWENDRHQKTFWGFTKSFDVRPYALILLCMVPLIALASTQPDFQQTYPKLKMVYFITQHEHPSWFWKLIYEISYGLDFVSIELFFRGFLVIGFIRFAGINSILPMAAFYCTIHFGKPLGECISSFFGGLALGVIAYRTRSILGGLMVHLGIAWLMENF
ncbi:MAG: abortive infection protein [Bacteroidetes bacterium]|nr:abortive infection protein [Bacteroidota bacterium]